MSTFFEVQPNLRLTLAKECYVNDYMSSMCKLHSSLSQDDHKKLKKDFQVSEQLCPID